ncbi:MAG: DNA translocase FtsK [Pseudomonadota bacterium]
MPSSNRPPRTYEPSFFNPAPAGAALPAGRPLLPKEAREAAFSPWVALELVPSWLRPFTLDENTRFTRTPDHFLRTRHGMGESPKVTSAPPVQAPPVAREAMAPEAPVSAPAAPSPGAISGPTSGPTWRFLVEETEPETQTASMAWSDAAEPAVALETLRAAVGDVSAVALTDLAETVAPAPVDRDEIALAPAEDAHGIDTPAETVGAEVAASQEREGQSRDIQEGKALAGDVLGGEVLGAEVQVGDVQGPDLPVSAVPDMDAPDRAAHAIEGHAGEAAGSGSDEIAAPLDAMPQDSMPQNAAPEEAALQEQILAAAVCEVPAARAPEDGVSPHASASAVRDDVVDGTTGQELTPEAVDAMHVAAPADALFQEVPLQDALLQDAPLPEGPEAPSEPRPARALPQTLLKLGRLFCLGEGFSLRPATEQDLLPVLTPRDATADTMADEETSGFDEATGRKETAREETAHEGPADTAPVAAMMADEASTNEALANEQRTHEAQADEARMDEAFPPLALSPLALPPAAAPVPSTIAEPAIAPVDVAAELPAPATAPLPLEPLSAIVGASFHWAFQGLNFRSDMAMPLSPAPSPAAPLANLPSVPVASSAAPVPAVPSRALDAGEEDEAYELPALALLREPPVQEPDFELSEEFLDQSSAILQQTLRDFGVRGEVIDANPGPVVTLYEFEPAPGTKSSRVIGLAADIARSMSAVSVRVAVVEGRNVIGIELPNRRRGTVWLRELLEGPHLDEAHAKLAIALGKTIGGAPVIVDLARMPHLLVAGTTGSGKSVAINTMILSLLYRHSPQACRLIMIDPKMLELSVYEGIPHLLTPVVTDPKKAIIALKWAVREMEDRYRKMSRLGVRNIDGFNARMAEARAKGEIIKRQVQVGFDKETGEALFEEQDMDLTALPFIVIIVDEMADLMLTAGKEIEGAIQRLAQMARAAGIHLVMATQRPSVDVITGTIKANFPTRISFQVTSKIDSRTILGEMGAEQLLGQGVMLYMASGGRITRVHGPFVSDGEVEKVVAHLKAQGGPEYLDAVTSEDDAEGIGEGDDAVFDKGALGEASGDLYEQAVAIVLRDRKASTSYIQRRLQVGYNKAASLMERMETEGIVGPANHAGKREILTGARTL